VKAKTSLATTLSGESKEGEMITVLEGSMVKDKATLSGKNASSATGKVKYDVYSDSECKTLVKEAGEVTVSGASVPASSEEELEGGKSYYWQASYSGDGLHQESKSTCGEEVSSVKAKTTLSTTLTGESMSGVEIEVLEGAGIKDEATLSGANVSTAGGKVKYDLYSDKECKTLVAEAGEETVTSGSVPASSEETPKAGTYYWQASYGGDPLHQSSTSVCGSEVAHVKTTTSLMTSLSSESKSGAEIEVLEGAGIKDEATLSGANVSTAGGKVKYDLYSDKECKTLVVEAGEETVTSGSVPASSEETPKAGTYYWQATYTGDGLNRGSTSTCGSEISKVKTSTSLTTSLAGEEQSGEALAEGTEITLVEGAAMVDTATLSGANSATAKGTVTYDIYSDNKCKTLVAHAGEVTVSSGSVPSSSEERLPVGTYYWQATYSGDSLNAESTSECGAEIVTIKAPTSLATQLSGEGQEGDEITVTEGAAVNDTATLSGPDAAMATGTVKYDIYSDGDCTELVTEAGEVTVAGEFIPVSSEQTLPAGTYYWQAVYSGDGLNYSSKSACGSEIEMVLPTLTTSLGGESQSGENVEVLEGAGVSDKATLHGENASIATGSVKYKIYSDEECEDLVTEAGEVTVAGEEVPASNEETLPAGYYYWQAEYSGDEHNPAATSACGAEVTLVATATSLTTSLSGESKTGGEIEVQENTAVSDTATLSGTNASTASGQVEYSVYSDSECKELVALAGDVSVSSGSVPTSNEETLPPGTYYWRAAYSAGGINQSSTSACGAEVEVVAAPITTLLSSGSTSGSELIIPEETGVSDKATLHGENASKATGTVKYKVYSDSECKELFTEAGEVSVAGEDVPASEEETLPAGSYSWQAEYSGDEHNPPETSACDTTDALVIGPSQKYAALGDSLSAGVGVTVPPPPPVPAGWGGIQFYTRANIWNRLPLGTPIKNRCLRTRYAWSARVAEAFYGAGAVRENEVFRQQPPSFIFRACSGSITENLWSGRLAAPWEGGLANESILGVPETWIAPNPAQNLWLSLPGGKEEAGGIKPNAKIKLLTLTIGINDAGFRHVAEACLEVDMNVLTVGRLIRNLRLNHCRAVIAQWEGRVPSPAGSPEGIASIEEKLKTVLKDAHKRAPNAWIRIPLYPRVFDLRVRPRIPVRVGLAIDNPLGPVESVAERIERYIRTVNQVISNTVAAWNVEEGLRGPRGARVLAQTVNAFAAGHLLGNLPEPWINGVILAGPTESFHPTCRGHIAVALQVLRGLKWAGIVPAYSCP
jgi:hypothetical protein